MQFVNPAEESRERLIRRFTDLSDADNYQY